MSHHLPADVEIFPAKQLLIHSLLHAMGQPLSALQLCVLLRDRGASAALPSDLLEDVADQVTTLSRLFCSLRELLCEAPDSRTITPAELMRFATASLPRWQELAATRQVQLQVEFPGTDEHAGMRPAPLNAWQQSLSQVVDAALLSASPHELVRLHVGVSDATEVTFSLQGGRRLSDDSQTARYALPVASFLLQGPGRTFTYSHRPFAANLTVHSTSSLEDSLSADRDHGQAKATA